VILLGQSLNAPRGTIVQSSGGDAGFAWMPAGGSSIRYWEFAGANQEHTGHWNELASAVAYAEETLQTPGAGIAATLGGGRYSRAYIGNGAIGSRTLEVLLGGANSGGPIANVWAIAFRLCEIARADGYEPEVMFYSAHGEANAAAGTPEQDYYDLGAEYYGRLQLYAAQAMRDPSYVAPVLLTYPIQQNAVVGNLGDNDRAIKNAIRRLAADLPGLYDAGAIYQWPAENDRVHPINTSYVQRGEHIGRMLRLVTAGTPPAAPMRATGVTRSGTSFTITFSKPVVRDDTLNVGQNLATATAEDGIEWFDNGVALAITAGSLVYSGNTITGTLASAPTGTDAQQVVRIAMQHTPVTLTAGANNLAGSVIRSNEDGWASTYDPLYTNRDWAIPQRIVGVN
jgi:hypothetical protein